MPTEFRGHGSSRGIVSVPYLLMSPQALRFSSIGELADRVPARRAFSTAGLWPPVVVSLAYYLGCLAGFALRYPGSGISFFWPPNAILTASLLLVPTRWWP